MKSSWCKSSLAKAVAGGPVASVAIRWVTGGCEAYTARKQAVRIQLRKHGHCDADAVRHAEGSIRVHRYARCVPESPESLARGMLSQRLPANAGELPISAEITQVWSHLS
jgi:hypothetical protein